MNDTFYSDIDAFYQRCEIDKAEQYLCSYLADAKREKNLSDQITIQNELIGLYRELGKFHQCKSNCEELIACASKLNIQDTLPYATTVLNVANAYRVMELYSESEEYFKTAESIYLKLLPPDDYRLASLYNNMSLIYQAQGDYQKAVEIIKKALQIIHQIPNAYIEEAVTYTNLATMLLECDETTQAINYLNIATKLFDENQATQDMHYAATLSALAHANYCTTNYEESLAYYEKAAYIIEKASGKTINYANIYKNIAKVYQTLKRPEDSKKALEMANQIIDSLN